MHREAMDHGRMFQLESSRFVVFQIREPGLTEAQIATGTSRHIVVPGELKQASRLNDDDPTIFEHLGDLYSRLEEFDQARKSYQASLKFATEDEERERAQKKLRDLDGTMRPESQ